MARLIKKFSDGCYLEYDRGNFDDWCVYMICPYKKRFAPKDVWYFEKLKQLSLKYSAEKIYNDFVLIYEATNSEIDKNVLLLITEISNKYEKEDKLEVEKIFTIIYAGMVAEENKKNAILKKRIKRLGIHHVLIDNYSPEYAANFSKRKRWQTLDLLCKNRGF